MDPRQRQLIQLRTFNAWVAENDPRLFEEAVAAAEAAKAEMPACELALTPETLRERMRQESIVLRTMRPVLAIKQSGLYPRGFSLTQSGRRAVTSDTVKRRR